MLIESAVYHHHEVSTAGHWAGLSTVRSNLRFQSLIGLTPERRVDYFFCI